VPSSRTRARLASISVLQGAGVDHALFAEPLAVDRSQRRVRLDLPVEDRLRERRVVPFVVAVPPVADQVDDHVLLEALPELDRQPRRVDAGLGIVRVHVEDRRLDHLGHVARVLREAVVDRVRGEADLVVHDDVNRPTRPVRVELRQRQRLGDDALTREGRVAVDLDRHDLAAVRVPPVVLLAAHDPLGDRVDRLEVARIRAERQVYGAARAQWDVGGVAAVILHVARSLRVEGHERHVEVGEDRAVGHRQRVRHDVESSAVRHRDHHLFGAQGRAVLDDRVEQGDQRLGPFEREALLAQEAPVQELLEPLGGEHAMQNSRALLRVERRAVQVGLHLLDQPVPSLLVPHLHELDRERPAVGRLQVLDELGRCALAQAQEVRAGDARPHVVLGEAELARLQEGVRLVVAPERIQVRDQVAVRAVGVHQAEDPDAGSGLHAEGHGRRRGGRRGCRHGRGRRSGQAAVPVAGCPPHQAVEESPPVVRDRGPAQQVVLEQGLHVGAVLTAQERGQIGVAGAAARGTYWIPHACVTSAVQWGRAPEPTRGPRCSPPGGPLGRGQHTRRGRERPPVRRRSFATSSTESTSM
jgi:hypothetical protein